MISSSRSSVARFARPRRATRATFFFLFFHNHFVNHGAAEFHVGSLGMRQFFDLILAVNDHRAVGGGVGASARAFGRLPRRRRRGCRGACGGGRDGGNCCGRAGRVTSVWIAFLTWPTCRPNHAHRPWLGLLVLPVAIRHPSHRFASVEVAWASLPARA